MGEIMPCRNSELGWYNQECGKPSVWVGRSIRSGDVVGMCDDCRRHGRERNGVADWRPVTAADRADYLQRSIAAAFDERDYMVRRYEAELIRPDRGGRPAAAYRHPRKGRPGSDLRHWHDAVREREAAIIELQRRLRAYQAEG